MSEFAEVEAPEAGDLVVGVVKRIERYGAYIDLLEYPGWGGLVHISEISLKWVRNIKDYLRENQREIFKVLRVDKASRQVDVSLRRVSQKEREWKILEWKRKQKVRRILSILAERSGKPEEEFRKKIVEPALKRNLSLYDVFLEVVEKDKFPKWMRLDEDEARLLIQLVKQEIKIKRATVKKTLFMSVPLGNGVEVIKKAAERGLQIARKDGAVSITTVGAPKYLLRVEAEDEEKAKQLIDKISSECIKIIREAGGRAELMEE